MTFTDNEYTLIEPNRKHSRFVYVIVIAVLAHLILFAAIEPSDWEITPTPSAPIHSIQISIIPSTPSNTDTQIPPTNTQDQRVSESNTPVLAAQNQPKQSQAMQQHDAQPETNKQPVESNANSRFDEDTMSDANTMFDSGAISDAGITPSSLKTDRQKTNKQKIEKKVEKKVEKQTDDKLATRASVAQQEKTKVEENKEQAIEISNENPNKNSFSVKKDTIVGIEGSLIDQADISTKKKDADVMKESEPVSSAPVTSLTGTLLDFDEAAIPESETIVADEAEQETIFSRELIAAIAQAEKEQREYLKGQRTQTQYVITEDGDGTRYVDIHGVCWKIPELGSDEEWLIVMSGCNGQTKTFHFELNLTTDLLAPNSPLNNLLHQEQ